MSFLTDPRNIVVDLGGDTLARYGTLTQRRRPSIYGASDPSLLDRETYTRAGSGWAVGRNGLLVPHGNGIPRIEWAKDPVNGVLQPYLLHESAAATNLLDNGDYEQDLLGVGQNPAPGSGGPTTTQDGTQFFSGTHACKVVSQATAGSGPFFRLRAATMPATPAGSTFTFSLWAFGTGTAIGSSIQISIEWYNATPTFLSQSATNITLAAGWNRYTVTGTAPATATQATCHFYQNAATAITYWVDGVQLEAGAFPTSTIPTNTATVTRPADGCTVIYRLRPQLGWFYARFLEGGSVVSNSVAGPLSVGSGAQPFCRFDSFANPGYRWSNQEPAGAFAATPAGSPTFGQVVELLGYTFADGSVQARMSINGAAETVSGQSASILPFSAAWSGAFMTIGGSGFAGRISRILHGVVDLPGSISELRDFLADW